MKCYKHYDSDVVAKCLDCGKGLCPECTDRWSFPVCDDCAQLRAGADKNSFRKQVLLMMVLFGLGFWFAFNANLDEESVVGASLLDGVVFGYVFASIPCGWGVLNRITPNIFLVLPLFGWFIYLFSKLFIASIIGPFVLPFTLYSAIKNYRNANQIQGIIDNA